MRMLIVSILLLVSFPVVAEWKLHVASHHWTERVALKQQNARNEVNLGVGYAKDNIEYGFFMNSEKSFTPYIHKSYNLSKHVAIFGGLMKGYKYGPAITPMAGLQVVFKPVQVTIFPGVMQSGAVVPVTAFSLVF